MFARLYRNEEFVMEYTGPRDRNSFISFIQNVNQAGSMLINKAKEIKNLLTNSSDKFFVSFAPHYPRLKTAYKEIAEELRPYGVHFYHVGPSFKVDKTLIERIGLQVYRILGYILKYFYSKIFISSRRCTVT